MRVYVEPVLPRPTLWIMGHGRVAECLCSLADMVGLDVVVNDPLVDRERYPAASRLITDDLDYGALPPRAGRLRRHCDAAQGRSRFHQAGIVVSGSAYIALIASRKRSRLVLDYLRQEGVGDQDIDRVMAPSGLDLGARTPEEIALCVVSEIVLVRRGGTGLRMRDKLREEREKPRLKAARS